MKPTALVGVAMLLVCVGWAQEKPAAAASEKTAASTATTSNASAKTPVATAKGKIPAKKVLTQEEQIALDLLESSLAGSRKLDPVSQGQAAWEAARIQLRHFDDKKKAAKALEEGFFRVLAARDEQRSVFMTLPRTSVEARLLQAMIPLNVARVEELLPQSEADSKRQVQSTLVTYYIDHGNDSRALELVRQMAAEHEMMYGDAITLMSHMKAGQESLLRDLFTEAMASYGAHEHTFINANSPDLTMMILRFWSQLPEPLVGQAIGEVLNQAKDADDKRTWKLQTHIATEKGEATFTEIFDYQLFALVPVLRVIDPVEADKRLRDSASARALLGQYANGMTDLAPSFVNPAQNSVRVLGYSSGDIAAPTNPDERLQIEISSEIGEHPESAMAKIPQMQNARFRAESYMAVASGHWKKHPAVAGEALRHTLEEAARCNPKDAMEFYISAAEIYVLMGDEEGAKKTLDKGTAVAAKLYAKDVNADSPNLAPVYMWPSSVAWLKLVRAGAKISPQWAVELLKSAPNEDVSSMGQLVIAAALLKVDYVVGESVEMSANGANYTSGEQENGKSSR